MTRLIRVMPRMSGGIIMNEVLSLRGGCYDVLGGLPGAPAAILPPGVGSLPETGVTTERGRAKRWREARAR